MNFCFHQKKNQTVKGLDGVDGINYEGFKIMENKLDPIFVVEKCITVNADLIHEAYVPEESNKTVHKMNKIVK